MKFGGRKVITLVRWWCNPTIICKENVVRFIFKVQEKREEVELSLKVKKTKVMAASENDQLCRIKINNEEIEKLKTIFFVLRLTEMEWIAMVSMKIIWKSKNITLQSSSRWREWLFLHNYEWMRILEGSEERQKKIYSLKCCPVDGFWSFLDQKGLLTKMYWIASA